jgi:S1-C subfamily serine protease
MTLTTAATTAVIAFRRPQQAPVMTAQEIAARSISASVLIRAFDSDGQEIGQGSGFLVSSDGKIVTNYHVIDGAVALRVFLRDSTDYEDVALLAADERRDLAVLKVPVSEQPFLPLGLDSRSNIGDKVYTVGSPLGLDGTFSEGLLSARRVVDGVSLLQMSAPVSPGSSGGPVLNAVGEVIGVTTASARGGQNLNIAVPARYVQPLLAGVTAPQRRFARAALTPLSGADTTSVLGYTADTLEARDADSRLKVVAAELGRRVGPNAAIVDTTVAFAPNDTIYVSIVTTGGDSVAVITADWSYQDGQSVTSSTQSIIAGTPVTTEFHISRPGGLPVGGYVVTIFLDGSLALSKGFHVR